MDIQTTIYRPRAKVSRPARSGICWRMMRAILSVSMLAVTLLLSLMGLLFLTESWFDNALSVASAAMLIALLALGVYGAWTVAMGRRPTLMRCLLAVGAYLSLVFAITAAEHARRFQRFFAADELAAQLQAHLHRQKRFSRIDADAMTSGGGGEVCVSGRGLSAQLANDLRSTVREFLDESHDVPVRFYLRSASK